MFGEFVRDQPGAPVRGKERLPLFSTSARLRPYLMEASSEAQLQPAKWQDVAGLLHIRCVNCRSCVSTSTGTR